MVGSEESGSESDEASQAHHWRESALSNIRWRELLPCVEKGWASGRNGGSYGIIGCKGIAQNTSDISVAISIPSWFEP